MFGLQVGESEKCCLATDVDLVATAVTGSSRESHYETRRASTSRRPIRHAIDSAGMAPRWLGSWRSDAVEATGPVAPGCKKPVVAGVDILEVEVYSHSRSS